MPITAVKIIIDNNPTPKLFTFDRAKTIKGIEKLFDIKMILNIVKKNFFRDSVQMMQFSQQLKDEQGVVDAAIVMGTDLNKNTLKNMDLLTEDGISATENDTLISINCQDENSLNNAEAVVGRDEFKSILIFTSSTLRYVIPFSFTISELLIFNNAVILGSSIDEIP